MLQQTSAASNETEYGTYKSDYTVAAEHVRIRHQMCDWESSQIARDDGTLVNVCQVTGCFDYKCSHCNAAESSELRTSTVLLLQLSPILHSRYALHPFTATGHIFRLQCLN